MYPTFTTEIYLDPLKKEIEKPITITISSWIGINEKIYTKVKKALEKQDVNPETAASIATAVSYHLKGKKRLTYEGMIKKLEVLCLPDGNIILNGVLIPFVFHPSILSYKRWDPPSISRQIAHATYLWHWRPK